ncbi:conserved hypothetical protein [Bosea sp. 62]|nr:conserved hypothetical protein [Bosea sp. 46]CAD5264354.1 conserved hypothetical protein [Bosea sp. 21B]CAD5275970.1 conserved hypothetical protein [Bosea sp. 7B]VVT59097.1 conserved hypothetical protein [Bosea sp. EC-HK365B]VXB68797.1 conserved hypothetical protein [Bosea sp. 29B]VXC09089.1 conserved hypothetical protein [Bosea sp. 125]VXC32413.1 conserved hypothetical protein [Bosea sp. 62]VXC76667.1 conserved hypothetical protein [Bosea sp. 127]
MHAQLSQRRSGLPRDTASRPGRAAKARLPCESLMTFRPKPHLPAALSTLAECHLYFARPSVFRFGPPSIQP